MSLIETSLIEPGSVSAAPRLSLSEPKDFLALLKPRVMSLVVLTAVTGMVVAPGTMNPVLAIVSILAIAVGAGASGALNMWYDADIDARMSRTKTRPVPSGRVEPDAALAFGLGLSIFSVMVLGLAANWFAAGFLAFTIFFYAVIYTMGLKRSTPRWTKPGRLSTSLSIWRSSATRWWRGFPAGLSARAASARITSSFRLRSRTACATTAAVRPSSGPTTIRRRSRIASRSMTS